MKKLSRDEMKKVMGGAPIIPGCGGQACSWKPGSNPLVWGRCLVENHNNAWNCYCDVSHGGELCNLGGGGGIG